MNFYAKFFVQFGGSFCKGFNHGHLLWCKALFNQATQNGACHVATANEGQVQFLKTNGSRCSHESFSRKRGGLERLCSKFDLFCPIRSIGLIVSFSEGGFRLIFSP